MISDIKFLIVKKLKPKDLLKVLYVNKSWLKLVDKKEIWQDMVIKSYAFAHRLPNKYFTMLNQRHWCVINDKDIKAYKHDYFSDEQSISCNTVQDSECPLLRYCECDDSGIKQLIVVGTFCSSDFTMYTNLEFISCDDITETTIDFTNCKTLRGVNILNIKHVKLICHKLEVFATDSIHNTHDADKIFLFAHFQFHYDSILDKCKVNVMQGKKIVASYMTNG